MDAPLGHKSPKIFLPNLSTDGQSDATFEAKKHQPQLHCRTLVVVSDKFVNKGNMDDTPRPARNFSLPDIKGGTHTITDASHF